MVTFEVKDMTCGHCVAMITQAVRSVDPGAKLQFDLPTHRVQIEPTASAASQPIDMSDAIRQAGYTPVTAPDEAAPVAKAAQKSGCCCR